MRTRVLIFSFIFFVWSPVGWTTAAIAQDTITTFVLVRHAEKVLQPKIDDPELTPEGKRRAEKIAALFAQTRFSAAYTTPYKRTIQTATPLAQAQHLTLQRYEATMQQASLAAFADTLLQRHAGGTVLIVGHSNTIPQFLNVLNSSTHYQQFDDADYDNIFIVAVTKRGKTSVTHLRAPL